MVDTAANFTPKSWDPNRITMGQVNGVINKGIDFVWNYELNQGFTPQNNPIDAYYAYYGNMGNASEGQNALLPLTGNNWDQTLTTGKTSMPISAIKAGVAHPILTIYSNDFSTSESASPTVPTNIQVRGELGVGGKVIKDGITTFTYDGTGISALSGKNTAVMELANLGLQAAGFHKQLTDAGYESGAGTLLFNPDGFGAMLKNLIGNTYSINSDPAANPETAIFLKQYQGEDPVSKQQITVNPTVIKWTEIATKAIDEMYSSPKYVSALGLGDEARKQAILTDLKAQKFPDDISGYLPLQAWMVKTFAPTEAVATVLNLWGSNIALGGNKGIGTDQWSVTDFAQIYKTYSNMLGWQSASKNMDFIAWDRYERDDLSGQVINGGQNAYAYTPTAWKNSLDSYTAASKALMADPNKQGVMLFQIPSGALPEANMNMETLTGMGVTPAKNYPTDNSSAPHAGIEQSYFWGQSGIGKSIPNAGIWNGFIGSQEIGMDLGIVKTKAYGNDLTYAQQIQADNNFTSTGVLNAVGNPLHNTNKVFAILWGGGDTSAPLSYLDGQWKGATADSVKATPLWSNLESYEKSTNIAYYSGTLDHLDIGFVRGKVAEYLINPASQANTSSLNAGEIVLTDTVAGRDKTLDVTSVERVIFSDGALAFDEGGIAGQVYNLYTDLLGRVGEKAGLGYWIGQLDAGANLADVAKAFLAAPEFQSLGAKTNAEFVDWLYQTGLERTADAGGRAYWIGQLDHGATRADIVVSFITSPEDIAQAVAKVGSTGLEYAPFHI